MPIVQAPCTGKQITANNSAPKHQMQMHTRSQGDREGREWTQASTPSQRLPSHLASKNRAQSVKFLLSRTSKGSSFIIHTLASSHLVTSNYRLTRLERAPSGVGSSVTFTLEIRFTCISNRFVLSTGSMAVLSPQSLKASVCVPHRGQGTALSTIAVSSYYPLGLVLCLAPCRERNERRCT